MSSAAPAKAIKAFVTGVIKDQLLESTASTSSSSQSTYNDADIAWMALLQMELVQRGVLVATGTDLAQWESTKILSIVQSSIGKPLLLDKGSPLLPNPLLAASAVMAGRTAELCASYYDSSGQEALTTTTTTKWDTAALQAALERCHQVHDARFQVLLEVLISNTTAASQQQQQQPLLLQHIAEGYYLRGAQFQPDTPQVWKKVQDVILARHGACTSENNKDSADHHHHQQQQQQPSPPDAAWSLVNLARIAATKGNTKRATEMNLKAAESYHQQWVMQQQQQQTAPHDNNDKTLDVLQQAFVTPYKPVTEDPLHQAQVALTGCQQHSQLLLSPDQVFVLQVLQVQVALAQEQAHIQTQAQFQYQQAQHRVADTTVAVKQGNQNITKTNSHTSSSTSRSAPSLATIQQATRRDILTSGNSALSDTMATALRDAYFLKRYQQEQKQENSSNNNNNNSNNSNNWRLQSAAEVMTQIVQRYRDRAQALACQQQQSTQQQGWLDLATFLQPIWNTYVAYFYLVVGNGNPPKQQQQQQQQDGTATTEVVDRINAMTVQEVELLETCMVLAPSIQRMASSSSSNTTSSSSLVAAVPPDLWPPIQTVLSALLDRALKIKREYQTSSNVLKTSTEPMDIHIRTLECARASSHALILLQKPPQDILPILIREHTEQHAIPMAQQQYYSQASLEFGTGFYNFLVAWSGLGSSPWSFCTAPEARIICQSAQQCLGQAHKEWGRSISELHQLLLDLGKADAEFGILSSGLPMVATKVYHQVLERASKEWKAAFGSLIKSHCWIGLARINLSTTTSNADPVELAQKGLEELSSLKIDQKQLQAPAHLMWTAPDAMVAFVKFHLSVSRQLVADALVRTGRTVEAKSFLEDAVRDAPLDAEAAFALGAFMLREALHFSAAEPSSSSSLAGVLNAAKMQLLQAAKLNSRKAGPFALLGVWYEHQKDLKRALGCYSKALLLDPPNPVAGRGVLRLTTWNSVKAVIDAAIQTSSHSNGWAWRALGKHKVMVTGENDLGAVALLKALRCRDIDQPQNDAMVSFFSIKYASGGEFVGKEKAESWAELAFCYRRMGRYTASIRGYYSSIEAAGEHVSGAVLCACAEAELGLGLAEEAAEKFKLALEMGGSSSSKSIAAYGQGLSLLSLAKRDAQDGKAGAAYDSIQRALDGFESSTRSFGCSQKLLGDLYSFGASLPPDVFVGTSTEDELENQIAFVQKGEGCYIAAFEYYAGVSDNQDESNLLRAALITDSGANILLRAQLTAFCKCNGLGSECSKTSATFPEISNLYERASTEFRRAVELSPEYAPAWCGLGCSLVFSDPLLAQHAFCRSIQLDNLSADAYSNLAFLYTAHHAFAPSEGVLDALTQVADSPMMWINRALMLERNAAGDIQSGNRVHAEESITQAADAYRAALQVVKHPSAMLGLALTCRVSTSCSGPALSSWPSGPARASFQEGYGYLLEYQGLKGSSDLSASVIQSLYSLESGANNGKRADIDSVVIEESALLEQKIKSLSDVQQNLLGDRNGGALDLELIEKCLSSDGIPPKIDKEEQVSTTVVAPPTVTLARQIVHEPQRGDLWVELAKELLRQDRTGDGSSSKTALASAHVAASRAVKILTHQLTFPSPTGTASSTSCIVHHQHLSEALMLQYWLSNLNPKSNKKETQNNQEVKEKVTSPPSGLDLQKALMICPNNKFAREAIVLAT